MVTVGIPRVGCHVVFVAVLSILVDFRLAVGGCGTIGQHFDEGS